VWAFITAGIVILVAAGIPLACIGLAHSHNLPVQGHAFFDPNTRTWQAAIPLSSV
jgi:hypothetical protein